jgi:hypothetical protein
LSIEGRAVPAAAGEKRQGFIPAVRREEAARSMPLSGSREAAF